MGLENIKCDHRVKLSSSISIEACFIQFIRCCNNGDQMDVEFKVSIAVENDIFPILKFRFHYFLHNLNFQ